MNDSERVTVQRGVRIPLRDGVALSAALYLPHPQIGPSPAIVTLTPYIGQRYHDEGVYFAAHGYPFLTVDVRGRGDSQGTFRPFIQEACDGSDIVEWLAGQPYCNGQVAMWGGSYAGYDQWATAKERPPHLVTIVPVASVCPGVDFPMRGNVTWPYVMRWLTYTSGLTSQEAIFADQSFWKALYRRGFEAGLPFKSLDVFVGNPSPIFQEWMAHPCQDAYWDEHNPTSDQYAKLTLPILTITGIYDADQIGALTFYRGHLKNAPPAAGARHYLVIGPWDHAGTRHPKASFMGLTLGPASLLDLPKLHLQWYDWTMKQGPRPEFLRQKVAYYVMGAETWRYADSLDDATARYKPLFLQSRGNPTDVFHSGALACEHSAEGSPDAYTYDPQDISHAELESALDPDNALEQRMVHALRGKQLIYHSELFAADIEVTGFFRLTVWLSIDQPDTDVRATVYEIGLDGVSTLLSFDSLRARFREGLREERRIHSTEPLRYDFERFPFVSRLVRKGSRLRLVIGPINSIHSQKNYNSGGTVSAESMQDARVVTVLLFHDPSHPSALYVPFGRAC